MIKRGNNYKAQITPFFLLAIVIIILLYILLSPNQSNNNNLPSEISPIYNYVENCLMGTTENAIIDLSEFGGYFDNAERSLENGMPYYYFDNNILPSKKFIESQFSSYIETFLPFCINSFNNFPDYKISEGKLTTNIEIKDNQLLIEASYPLTITKSNTLYLDNFNIRVPSRLGIMYKSAEYLINDHANNPSSICLACQHDLSTEYNLSINTLNYNDNSIIYSLTDNDIKIDNKELVYNFAIKLEEL